MRPKQRIPIVMKVWREQRRYDRERQLSTYGHEMHYVGFGGYRAVLPGGNVELGWTFGTRFENLPRFGIRRALWDAAMGYVSGYPLSAILYFVVTRSFSLRVQTRAIARERRMQEKVDTAIQDTKRQNPFPTHRRKRISWPAKAPTL